MNRQVMEAGTWAEHERIYRFRDEILFEEASQGTPEADETSRTLRDDLDERATHFYLERDGHIVGATRVIWGEHGIPAQYNESCALTRFGAYPASALCFTGPLVVARAECETLTPVALARSAYGLARRRGVAFDFLHAAPDQMPFFLRLGHRRFGPDYADPELGPRVPLVLVLQDAEHLQECRSPLVSLAATLSHPSPPPVEWFRREFPAG
jgi:hypothetical protein